MPTLELDYATNDELAFLDTAKTRVVIAGDKVEYAAAAVDKESSHGQETTIDEDKAEDVDVHNKPYYDVPLNYRLDPADGGTEMMWGGTMHLMRRKWHPFTVRTHNARGQEKNFSLDTTGFQFEHFPASYKDFPWNPMDEKLKKEYDPELEAFMKRVTGATDVRLISHIIRQRDWRTDPEEDSKKPDMAMTDGGILSARYVHVDQSDLGAKRRLIDDLSKGEWAEHDGKHRWAIVNLWRPLQPILREPLTLCDARSVRDDELFDTMHCVPFRWPHPPSENHMWLVSPPETREQHKWWFRSGMTRDDVILIKIFDSKRDGRARRTPHCAFPSPDDVGPARKSIETRFFLFWENDTCE